MIKYVSQIDWESFLIGVGFLLLLYIIILILRKLFRKKEELNLDDLKKSITIAHEFLAGANKELNDIYVFINKIEKKTRELQG